MGSECQARAGSRCATLTLRTRFALPAGVVPTEYFIIVSVLSGVPGRLIAFTPSMWLRSVCLVVHPRLRSAGIRTGLALSYLTLRSDALATSTSTIITRSLRMCAFRGRSRHTSGFEPYETFELPPQEMKSALRDGDDGVRLNPTRGSDVFQWIETSVGDEELMEAAARCVSAAALCCCSAVGQVAQHTLIS